MPLQLIYKDACGAADGSLAEQELTVGDVNTCLDELASNQASHDVQGRVLASLLSRCSPRTMAYVTYVLLKDMSVGHWFPIFPLWKIVCWVDKVMFPGWSDLFFFSPFYVAWPSVFIYDTKT